MAQRICQKESLDLIESLSSEREKTVSPILPPSSSRNLLSLSLSLEQFECRIHTSFSCVLPRILAAFWDALGQDMVENGSGDFFC